MSNYKSKYKGVEIDALLDEVAEISSTYALKGGSTSQDFNTRSLSVSGNISMQNGVFSVTDESLSFHGNFSINEDGDVICSKIDCGNIMADGDIGVSGDVNILDVFLHRGDDTLRIIDDTNGTAIDIPTDRTDKVMLSKDIPHIQLDGILTSEVTIEQISSAQPVETAYWYEPGNCFLFRTSSSGTIKYYLRALNDENFGNAYGGQIVPFDGVLYVCDNKIYQLDGGMLHTASELGIRYEANNNPMSIYD